MRRLFRRDSGNAVGGLRLEVAKFEGDRLIAIAIAGIGGLEPLDRDDRRRHLERKMRNA
jgi:hypothetical protein